MAQTSLSLMVNLEKCSSRYWQTGPHTKTQFSIQLEGYVLLPPSPVIFPHNMSPTETVSLISFSSLPNRINPSSPSGPSFSINRRQHPAALSAFSIGLYAQSNSESVDFSCSDKRRRGSGFDSCGRLCSAPLFFVFFFFFLVLEGIFWILLYFQLFIQ